MSGKSVVDQIKHYQKDIERCPDNTERMIRCIQRLYVLPVKVEHLQETGVGRSVNSLRKYKGEVGDAAKALVAKWKAMVAEEESSDESHDAAVTRTEIKVSTPPPSPVPPSKCEQKSDRHSSKDKINHKNHSSDNKIQHNEKKLHNSGNKSASFESKGHNSVSKSHNSESKTNSSESKSQKTESKSLKSERKSSSSDSKPRSSDSKSYSSDIKSSSSSDKKSHNSVNKPRSSSSHSKSHDKHSESKSSSSKKIQDSSSPTNNHVSEKKSSSHKSHKSNYDKKRKSDSDDSPPHKKHKHHNSRSHSSSKRKAELTESDSEDESSSSDGSYASAVSNVNSSRSENESDNDSANSNSANESDSDSSSDHRHRSNHKSSHHKHKHSSHHKETAEVKHKERSKEKEKHKERSHNKKDKHSSKITSSPGYSELIRENEKKIKKEKDEFVVPKKVHSSKSIKLETNEDGSIDSGSGASFADALLGMDNLKDTKKKKKPLNTGSSSSGKSSSKSSSKGSSSKSDSYSKMLKASVSPSSSCSSSPSKARSIDELVEPPELLTKRVKLEALDLDFSSTLPEINPNYKPLPHVPESSRRPSKTMTEEAMFNLMTSKNQRTKVYSGNKVYQSTIPSLFSLCIQLLYDNIDAMEYTGGVPYNILKPLLERLNADQLYVLEHFNPYLIEDTDELWKFHCSKDFRSQKLQDMETWRELYLRCLEERERKLKALTANITQSMAKSTPVRQAKLAYVDSVVKPPRNVARKQAKYGTGSSSSSTSSSSKNPTKLEIVNKAVVGGNTPGVSADEVVPTPRPVARAAAHHPTPTLLKKKKAPLMQKALQVMKGTRYKR